MEPTPFSILLNNYLADQLSPEELNQFLEAIQREENLAATEVAIAEQLKRPLKESVSSSQALDRFYALTLQKATQLEAASLEAGPAPSRRRFALPLFTLTTILVIGFLFYWQYQFRQTEPAAEIPIVRQDIAPGSNQASLTLSDGRKIQLDSSSLGQLGTDAGVRIEKMEDGQILYKTDLPSNQPDHFIGFNTLATPTGGQYQLVLPDGSTVWLNAASELTYPVKFTGKQRSVELSGEAYFDIRKNPDQPFIVKVRRTGLHPMEIKVLGTKFNINAYAEEDQIQTTLEEGAVQMQNGNAIMVLQPGEQGFLATNANAAFHKKQVDVQEFTAWKNGLFRFIGADITHIMRQLSRWYGIEVIYNTTPPTRRLVGEISRNVPLSKVLHILELNGIKTSLEGKKLTVY